MKDTTIQMKVSKAFKSRVKKGADYFNLNITQFVINAINEKLDRMGK